MSKRKSIASRMQKTTPEEKAVLRYWKARSKNAGYIEGTPGKDNWRVVIYPVGGECRTPRIYSEMAAARMLIEWRKAFRKNGTYKVPNTPTIDCAVIAKPAPVHFLVKYPPNR